MLLPHSPPPGCSPVRACPQPPTPSLAGPAPFSLSCPVNYSPSVYWAIVIAISPSSPLSLSLISVPTSLQPLSLHLVVAASLSVACPGPIHHCASWCLCLSCLECLTFPALITSGRLWIVSNTPQLLASLFILLHPQLLYSSLTGHLCNLYQSFSSVSYPYV